MVESTERFPALRVTLQDESEITASVASEFPVTIMLNNRELVTLLCSPSHLEYLAAGFLASEGFITARDDIRNISVDEKLGLVRVDARETGDPDDGQIFRRVITSGCGRGAYFYSAADTTGTRVDLPASISAEEVFTLAQRFQHNSELYPATHGVHSAALFEKQDVLVFSDDIGRHNAIDKVFGRCLLEGIPTEGRGVITTGRVTSEILHKVVKRGIPILISLSAPTNLGVRIADALGITLIASVRGRKMHVYTGDWRLESASGVPRSGL